MNKTPTDTPPKDEAVARKLAALAHPARLGILRQLGSADSCCVKDLVRHAGLAQSTVSQHLKILVEAELVSFRAERQCSRYAINAPAVRELSGVIGQTLDHCCAGCCPHSAHDAHTDPLRQPGASAPAAGHKDI